MLVMIPRRKRITELSVKCFDLIASQKGMGWSCMTGKKKTDRRCFGVPIIKRWYSMSLFENKVLLITGGTGSFGNAVLNRFLNTDIAEIRIFSRDEKKQDDMRHEFQAKLPEAANKIKFFIGDVRDIQSVSSAMHGVDYIFHAAALKQVPS